MEYKVGDKIRIKDDLKESRGYKVSCVSNMLEFKGKECIITKVIEQEYTDVVYYNIDIDVSEWSFTDDMFDLVFTKDDLKPFQVVEFRNGQLAIVCEVKRGIILGHLDNNRLNYFLYLSIYDNNLTYSWENKDSKKWDIMKVYGYSNSGDVLSVNTEYRELLWERVEVNPRIKELEDEIKSKNDELSKLIDELNNLK